jgi:hypothetical protein
VDSTRRRASAIPARELRFDNAAEARLEVEDLRSTAAIAPDPFAHRVDLREQIGSLPGVPPNLLCERDELLATRSANHARACQRLDFPELCAIPVVAGVSLERTG